MSLTISCNPLIPQLGPSLNSCYPLHFKKVSELGLGLPPSLFQFALTLPVSSQMPHFSLSHLLLGLCPSLLLMKVNSFPISVSDQCLPSSELVCFCASHCELLGLLISFARSSCSIRQLKSSSPSSRAFQRTPFHSVHTFFSQIKDFIPFNFKWESSSLFMEA